MFHILLAEIEYLRYLYRRTLWRKTNKQEEPKVNVEDNPYITIDTQITQTTQSIQPTEQQVEFMVRYQMRDLGVKEADISEEVFL
jgi:hypothetical protein